MKRLLAVALGLVALVALAVAFGLPSLLHLAVLGEQRHLPDSGVAEPPTPRESTLLLLALDGVDRSLLYELLKQGELPVLASLLGGDADNRFPHAHLDTGLLSTLPSSTLAAWATVFSGVGPARHGVTGNEYFIREQRRFAAPAPVSVLDPAPVLETYTEGYANRLLESPTLYELARERKPELSSWVSMSQFYTGATRLLLADRSVVADAFKALLAGAMQEAHTESLYAQLDREVLDTLCDALEKEPAPHVITLYLTGTDHYAHSSELGPDVARRAYLKDVVDPALARLKRALEQQDALASRYVVVTSDHGHTAVLNDERHALSTDDEDDPPAVLRAAGFRLRPFELEVKEPADFQSVLAYGGAMAYVYLADRSSYLAPSTVCDWNKPPRFHEDVLHVAEAFHQANETGKGAAGLRGTLDLILTRRPRPFEEDDLPFDVYLGGGRLASLREYLSSHPRDAYVAFEARLEDLAVGRYGERAGDILLLAHNGDVERAQDRYYFSGLYHSWHGSPSRRDSEVPFILANREQSSASLAAATRRVFGDQPRQQDIVKLLLELIAPTRAR